MHFKKVKHELKKLVSFYFVFNRRTNVVVSMATCLVNKFFNVRHRALNGASERWAWVSPSKSIARTQTLLKESLLSVKTFLKTKENFNIRTFVWNEMVLLNVVLYRTINVDKELGLGVKISIDFY